MRKKSVWPVHSYIIILSSLSIYDLQFREVDCSGGRVLAPTNVTFNIPDPVKWDPQAAKNAKVVITLSCFNLAKHSFSVCQYGKLMLQEH